MSKELIRLSDCVVKFDDEIILDHLNLYINDKEFLTLLGPDDHWWVSKTYLRRRFF